MNPPHFLLVTGTLQCGGSERQLADMANYWAAEGLAVTLATWSGSHVADFYRLDGRIRRAHLNAANSGKILGNVQRIRNLRRLIDEMHPDAVLSFLTRSNVPTILAGIGRSTRIVVSERVQPSAETGLQLGWRMLRRLVYDRADAIVCQTRATAEWIGKNWRHAPVVIPNALRPLPASQQQRENLILAVGRLVPQKGFDLLLEAFARIAPEFPEWRVAIAGEGPERDRLDELRHARGLAKRVEFLGHVPDIESWMARAGLVVQPSRFEGFPNAVLESMGMGAAVISADCPAGPAELIQDGVNGRLVPVENVDALAQAMRELMRAPELRAQFGRSAARVRERYRQEAIMEQWKSVLGSPMSAEREISAGTRFEFGENWTRFLELLDERRIAEAEDSLRKMLAVEDLRSQKFLDVGCGSGLFSLAARRLGASVHSFDFDEQSVACARELKRRYCRDDAGWRIEGGSVLDAAYMQSLGEFDVVYSWGVLHHTGAMWVALEQAIGRVAPAGGQLFIAIYADQGWKSRAWWHVKHVYNRLPKMLRPAYVFLVSALARLALIVKYTLLLRPMTAIAPLLCDERARGMSAKRDEVDWIGGFPYEYATLESLTGFLKARGFAVQVARCAGSLGCHEIVARRG